MDTHDSYTAQELAVLLKVSKLTVYDLIKKGELPAYRVGRQMRVDAAELERYKRRSRKAGELSGATAPGDRSGMPSPSAADDAAAAPRAGSAAAAGFPGGFPPVRDGTRALVITGQDVSLDVLARHIEKRTNEFRPLRSAAGSMNGLVAMYLGQADIASAHLLDGSTGEYNLPYIRKLLSGFPYMAVHLVKRRAGFYVAAGNPKRIVAWTDLRRGDITIVNREKGSGARVLLDEQLRLNGIPPREVAGYGDEETSHLGVAGKIATGRADAGVGSEKAAALAGVEFVPMTEEHCDLVMLRRPDNAAWIALVLDILQSGSFRGELAAIGGYDVSQTGRIIEEA